jgi:hypothetical protein
MKTLFWTPTGSIGGVVRMSQGHDRAGATNEIKKRHKL